MLAHKLVLPPFFVLPCEDLTVQKLVLLCLETIYKGEDVYGDVYIRGITLSFLSRLRGHGDLLEPLAKSVLVNLYHRYPFVRRQAYTAAFAIYLWLPNGSIQLLPDLLELVEHKLPDEWDAAATRNALLMLWVCAQERAVAYLLANAADVVAEWPGTVQMAAIAMMRGDCSSCLSRKKRKRFLKIIMSILSTCSNSNSVVYKAAGVLLSLCSEPVAVRAAADAYYRLLCSSSDKDVESTVLDRLDELRISHSDVMM